MIKFAIGYISLVAISCWLMTFYFLIGLPVQPINWPFSAAFLSLLIIPIVINFRYNKPAMYSVLCCAVASGLGYFWYIIPGEWTNSAKINLGLNSLGWAAAAIMCYRFEQIKMFYLICAKFLFGIIAVASIGLYRGADNSIFWALADAALYVAILVPPVVQSWRWGSGETKTEAGCEPGYTEHKKAA